MGAMNKLVALAFCANAFSYEGDGEQVEAENAFGDLLRDIIGPEHFENYEEFALKATTSEMMDYGLTLAREQMEVEAELNPLMQVLQQAKEDQLAEAQALFMECLAYLQAIELELLDVCHFPTLDALAEARDATYAEVVDCVLNQAKKVAA